MKTYSALQITFQMPLPFSMPIEGVMSFLKLMELQIKTANPGQRIIDYKPIESEQSILENKDRPLES